MLETVNRPGERMQGHGDHWGCLGDAIETFAEFISSVCNAKDARVVKGEPIEIDGQPANVLSMAAPPDRLGALVLHVVNDTEKTLEFRSAYPFAAAGVRHRLRIARIEEWNNGIEARIEAAIADGSSLGFFDTLYHANKLRYEIGRSYDFVLAAIAYRLKVVDAPSVWLTDPEAIRCHRRIWAEAGEPIEGGGDEPIEIETGGAAMLIAKDGWDIDDFTFQVPVATVSSFDLAGQVIHAIEAPLFFVDGNPFDCVIYAAAHALDGPPPKPGDDAAGSLWLQGYLAE